ncbi:MAG: folate-binding protein YgfZ [Solirubrobacterales bacterium]|nr:folate-binding protein YgfZ [Solirubrobacterales bacterium]
MASGPESAHAVLTTACGLVDRSARGKLALTGEEAAGLLTGQVTNDIEALADGHGCYAALLTNKGKMLGDLRVLRIGGEAPELHLDCERACLQALFDQLRRAGIGWQAELHKRTVQEGLFSLLGPNARRVAGVDELPREEHAHAAVELAGAPARAVATDLGVDVICRAEDAELVEAALIEAGAEPVPEAAADVLRVATGRPRYGVDLDDSVIPQEAGLNERAVSFTKGCYVGQETVARLHWRGKPNRHLRGVRLDGPAGEGTPLVSAAGKAVGALSSVVEHPELGWIALAIVRREIEPGVEVTLGDADGDIPAAPRATVVALPFA